MHETFSFSSTISSSWKLIKTHAKFVTTAVLAGAIIFIVLQILSNATERSLIGSVLMTIISIVVGAMISLGSAQAILKLIKGSASKTWHDFKTDYRTWGHFIVAQIVYGLFTIGSLIILFAPIVLWITGILPPVVGVPLAIIGFVAGIGLFVYISIRLMFLPFVAVTAEKMNGSKLIKKASHFTKGYTWDLLGFIVVLTLINIVGLLLFFVGLLFTIPLTLIAKGYAYEYLKNKHQ